jgi:hypothetical protein
MPKFSSRACHTSGGVSGIVSADGVFALSWVAVAILEAVE